MISPYIAVPKNSNPVICKLSSFCWIQNSTVWSRV